MKKFDVFEMVNNLIIERMEKGVIPWQQPWKSSSVMPRRQEELVPELVAAYLSAMCGIENTTIDNSAAYIKGWLSELKNDNKFFIQAASYAQHEVVYIFENQIEHVVPVQEEEFVTEESFSF